MPRDASCSFIGLGLVSLVRLPELCVGTRLIYSSVTQPPDGTNCYWHQSLRVEAVHRL
jgi:hypothetical protein